MMDVEKFFLIYKDIKKLDPEQTLQLTLAAKTKAEQDFWMLVGDYLLQQAQKQVIMDKKW